MAFTFEIMYFLIDKIISKNEITKQKKINLNNLIYLKLQYFRDVFCIQSLLYANYNCFLASCTLIHIN